MHSALLRPEVVDQYLPAELAEHRVVGPYLKLALSEAHVSRLGVIQRFAFTLQNSQKRCRH